MPTETATLEIVSPVEAKLVEFAGKTGLEQSSTTPLVDAFRPIFIESRKVLAAAVGVAESVKDATCVSEIRKARECRLAIRRVRIDGEKVKKAQKAAALTYGRAVDGFYNILEADLAPVEQALQDAEDTAERAETARKDALEQGRKAALAPFVSDVALYAVRDMAEPAFAALLAGVKLAKEQADAAAKKAEEDRIAKEKAEAAERERVRAENARLKQEAEAKEAALKIEREAAAKAAREAAELAAREKAAIEAKAKIEREAAEAQARKEREAAAAGLAEQQRKAKAERDAIEAKAREDRAKAEAAAKKERDARAKVEAELKAQREAAAKIEADRIAAEKKAAAAPIREKVMTFAASLRALGAPDVPQDLRREIAGEVERVASWVQKKAASL